MNDYDAQTLYDVILEMIRPRTSALPQHIVNVLDKHFPDSAIVFLTGPSFELYIHNHKRLALLKNRYYCQPTFSNRREHLDLIGKYWESFVFDDPHQPPNLPKRLQGRRVIYDTDFQVSGELSDDVKKYMEFMSERHNASIYMYHNDICIGAVAIIRSKSHPDFSTAEKSFFEQLQPFLTALYVSYIRECFYASIATIYRDFYEPENTGLALITGNADTIEESPLMSQYYSDILITAKTNKAFSTLIASATSNLAKVVRYITRSYSPITQSIKKIIITETARYTCEIKPCLMTGLSSDIHTLFIFTIKKNEIVNETSTVAAAAEQYGLTNREAEIVELLLSGCRNSDISSYLHISASTTKTHIYNIFKKMDISSRIELFRKYDR